MKTIALIGFMAVGKTAVARVLAKALQYEMVDLDEVISEDQELSIAEIFSLYGEDYFRQLEHEAVLQYSTKERTVIATGGGAMLSPKNRQTLHENCYVICLVSTPQVILERAQQDGATRPLLAGEEEPLEAISQMMAERAACYQGADLYIDTSGVPVAEIVQRIMGHLSKAMSQSEEAETEEK